jgi:SAM-dependent methyltransferase
MAGGMADWVSFWNSANSIYVNDHHRDVHYRLIADGLRIYVPSPDAVVLDYGCGEALHADSVADAAARLVLCDAAPNVRAALAERFKNNRKIEVRSPEEIEAMAAAAPGGVFDLVVMHSVAQYLDAAQMTAALALFRRVVKSGGTLILGDVIPPNVSPITDAMTLLRFGAAHGFLIQAVLGLVRTALSDYPKLRSRLGLSMYTQDAMLEKLNAARFVAQRLPQNIGHNQSRMAFSARPDRRAPKG